MIFMMFPSSFDVGCGVGAFAKSKGIRPALLPGRMPVKAFAVPPCLLKQPLFVNGISVVNRSPSGNGIESEPAAGLPPSPALCEPAI
jgi:hypothetical protein